jgi:hypothetical protein
MISVFGEREAPPTMPRFGLTRLTFLTSLMMRVATWNRNLPFRSIGTSAQCKRARHKGC